MRLRDLAIGAAIALAPAQAGACGTALVALIDGSLSFEEREWNHVVQAHIYSFMGDRVIREATSRGLMLAVSGFAGTPTEIAPLTRISSEADMRAFVRYLEPHTSGRSIQTGDGTGTGSAVLHALNILSSPEAQACDRRVIDVVTDGESNIGFRTDVMRDRAEAARVIINAVTMETTHENPVQWARDNLVTRQVVTNGEFIPAGFVVEARTRDEWARAISSKMTQEVAAR